MAKKTKRTYSRDFRESVRNLIRQGKPYEQISRQKGVPIGTIGTWARKTRRRRSPHDARLEQLSTQIAQLGNLVKNLASEIRHSY